MPNLKSVFIVDANRAQLASLEVLLHQAGWKTEGFASAGEFLARPPLLASSCLLLDLDPSDRGNLDLLHHLITIRPETPVIAMSSAVDVPTTVRAMQAGAIEFLVKPLTQEVVLAAVRHALARSETLVQQEWELRELRKRYDELSAREREVMSLVVAGLLNKQVGASLGISEITVKAHRGKLMRKMAADSLAQLVVMALRLGLSSRPAANGTVWFKPASWTGFNVNDQIGRILAPLTVAPPVLQPGGV